MKYTSFIQYSQCLPKNTIHTCIEAEMKLKNEGTGLDINQYVLANTSGTDGTDNLGLLC